MENVKFFIGIMRKEAEKRACHSLNESRQQRACPAHRRALSAMSFTALLMLGRVAVHVVEFMKALVKLESSSSPLKP